VEAYSSAIETDPGQVDLFLHRSRVREKLGDTVGAVEDLQRFLDLAPAEHLERAAVQERLPERR
jgi:regulator of sirC expression with transglutaminase-like and TPR domain